MIKSGIEKLYGYEDEITKYVIERFNKMKSERENWEDHWQELVEYIMPRKDVIWNQSKGDKRRQLVLDAHQVHANEMLASALHSRLTNPAVQWFGLSSGDPKLDQNEDVLTYLQDSTEVFHSSLNNSNFQTQVAEMYQDLTGINTSVLMVDEDPADDMIFKASPIWDHYIDEDYRGRVDTVYTEREMTVRQFFQEFGKDAFQGHPQKEHHLHQLERDESKMIHVLHAVFPRKDRDENKKDSTNMPYASVEILLEFNLKVKESGYEEMPYIVSRFSVVSGEKYGRGPGTKALADIKMLQAMVRVIIKAGQKAADPITLAPDDAAYLPVKQKPGAINYYRAGSEDRISYLESKARVDITYEMIERVSKKIDQAFYIDQLKLIEGGPQMTATESQIRDDQNSSLLSPVLSRQHYEFLRPLIDRVFGILQRKGKLPEAPEILEGKDLQVRYASQIARAQKRSMLTNIGQFQQAMAPVIEIDPNTAKLFNGIKTGRHLAQIMDIPNKILNSDKEISKMQQQEEQMKQQAMQSEMALKNSQTAKNLQGPAEALVRNNEQQEEI